MLEKGQIVGPGVPAFTLSGTSEGYVVRANLVDREALTLEMHTRATVIIDAQLPIELSAEVTRIATVASPGTGTFEVELTLNPNPSAKLLAGLTAKVLIERKEQPPASLPLTALVDGEGDRAFIYSVERNRAKRIPVHVTFLAGDRVGLAVPLEGIFSIVGTGAADLTDGALVRVVP
jgi:multidrug efflux pump subunit AcrA (membrane-fusion protein)